MLHAGTTEHTIKWHQSANKEQASAHVRNVQNMCKVN